MGWEPEVTLEQGLREMIEWYLARGAAAKQT
jgi:nucleoside-diphosphate-sugar epimerase